MKHFAFLLLAFLVATPLASAGTLAQFHTILGDIEVELFDQDKPVTVQNFVRYVQSGRYQTTLIHRWQPGFVIQGGGYVATNLTNINAVFPAVTNFGTITNEFSVGRQFSNQYGTIAMARVGGQTNSATSQWFINLTNNAFLDTVDGGFTVFGRVVRGTNLLNRFNDLKVVNGVYTNGIYNYQREAPFNQLPVLQVSTNPPTYQLFITDIAFLYAQLNLNPDGLREISWNSVSNKLNTVEFTTNFPPDWQSLTVTNGTGETFKFVDSSITNSQRFYRVRVEY